MNKHIIERGDVVAILHGPYSGNLAIVQDRPTIGRIQYSNRVLLVSPKLPSGGVWHNVDLVKRYTQEKGR